MRVGAEMVRAGAAECVVLEDSRSSDGAVLVRWEADSIQRTAYSLKNGSKSSIFSSLRCFDCTVKLNSVQR